MEVEPSKDLWTMLDEGHSSLKLDDVHREGVLVLGNPGSGKTTVIQLIAGNLNKMHSVLSSRKRMIIVDDDARNIGFQTLKSKAVIPELVLEKYSGTAYYDCPGFDDNRAPDMDIIVNGFLKKMTDHLTKFKLIFVISYGSLPDTRSADLDKLAMHASDFVKNITTFVNGMTLVVTMTPGMSQAAGLVRPEEEIRSEIRAYLENYLKLQQNKLNYLNTTMEVQTVQGTINFVRNILPDNFAFVRNPRVCGTLSSNLEMQQARVALRNMVSSMKFIAKNNDTGFDYSLKKVTKIHVSRVADGQGTLIREAIRRFMESVENVAKGQVSGLQDVHAKADFYRDKKTIFSQLIDILSNDTRTLSKPLKVFQEITKQLVSTTDHSPLHQFHTNLKKADDILEFLDEIAGNGVTISRNTVEWISPIVQYTDGPLCFANTWYDFLIAVDEEFGYFENQKRKNSIAIPDNPEEPEFLRGLGIRNLPTMRIEDAPTYYSTMVHTDLKLTLNSALGSSQISCGGDGKILYVKGDYVILSEIVGSDDGLTQLYESCQGTQFLNIYASRKLFVNSNIQAKGSGLQVSMIAPVLEVTGNTLLTIDLSGKDGPPPPKPKRGCGSVRGSPGEPGEPGGPGGSFLGVFGKVERGDLLQILADGGKGGAGQDGQAGCNGVDGSPGNKSDLKYESVTWWSSLREGRADGKPGGQGYPGGPGGAGGLGGIAGVIQIIPGSNSIRKSRRGGLETNGAYGLGGQGGKGGKKGKTISCSYRYSKVKRYPCKYTETTEEERSPSGSRGIDGGNTNLLQPPATLKDVLLPWAIVNEYKAHAFSIESPISVLPFIKELDQMALELTNPKAFSHEVLLYQTEVLANQGMGNPQFLTYYKTLPARIEKFANQTRLSSEAKLILSKLYATVSSTLMAITTTQVRQTGMVINVLGFLNVVRGNLNSLKESLSKDIVRHQTSKFKKGFEQKIGQALYFIESVIQPTLSSIKEEMDDATDSLLENVVEYTKDAEVALENEKKLKRDLQRTIQLRQMFQILNGFGKVVSLFGAVGGVIGGAMGTTSFVSEALLVGDSTTVRQQTTLPSSIRDHVSSIKSQFRKSRISELNSMKILIGKFLEDMKMWRVDKPVDLILNFTNFEKDVNRALAEAESGVPNSDLSLLRTLKGLLSALENFRGQLKERLQTENLLEADQRKPLEEVIFDIEKFQVAIKFGEAAVRLYSGITRDRMPQFPIVSAGIEKAQDNLQRLNAYRESVFQTLIPDIDRTYLELEEISERVEGQSSVPLQMTKWEIQTKLKEFKFRLKQMTEGQRLEEKFILCLEKLEEGLTLLINLHETIDGYKNQMELAQFMANINQAVTSNNIVVTDPETDGYLTKLDISLQTQSFLKEYRIAVEAVKQWVFPFANLHLKDLQLPKAGLRPDQTAVALGHQISTLEGRIKKYKTVILKGQDNCLRYHTFSSKFVSSHPFFVWEGDKWSTSVRELLAGKPTSLVADIDYAAQRSEGAVKFNTAELVLTARTKGNQTWVDELMKKFGITMTHSGVSHYSIMGSRYFMVGENQTYSFNYEVDEAGDRLNPTSTYLKFKKGDYLLSPYTTWTFQILKANSTATFADLRVLKGLVDLELRGKGSYVDEVLCVGTSAKEDWDLDQYYERA